MAKEASPSGKDQIAECLEDEEKTCHSISISKKELSFHPNCFQAWVERTQTSIVKFCEKHKKLLTILFNVALIAAYHAYFVAAIVISGSKTIPLIVVTVFAWLLVLYYYIYMPYLKKQFNKVVARPALSALKKFLSLKYVKSVLYILMALTIVIFILVDASKEPVRLNSLAGMVAFLLIGFFFSKNTARIHYRPIITGLFLQFCMSLVAFRWSGGLSAFNWVAQLIVKFLQHTEAGTAFVFGFVADPPNICGLAPALMFTVFQVIIFFGAVVNVLYYYGVIQWLLLRVAWFVHHCLGTTAVESVYAVASTILGMSEAPLIIKPYLIKLTDSELHQILVSGYASIAGSLFAAYIAFGACSEYLLAASIMSAPMSLCMSKLFYPETEQSRTKHISDLVLPKGEEKTVVEAIANGAYGVVAIVAIVGANLVVFIAAIDFLNNLVGWLGALVGLEGLTLELMYSYLFFPLAFLMGPSDSLDWNKRVDETMAVAELIGTKAILNEFLAYRKMGQYIKQGRLGKRAQMVATYALCGYSNIAAIGIQIGGLTGLCPEKKHVVPSLAIRALVAGSVSNFMTACFAGLVARPQSCPLPSEDKPDCFNLTGVNLTALFARACQEEVGNSTVHGSTNLTNW